MKHFGIDGWFIYGGLDFKTDSQVETRSRIVSKTEERIVQEVIYSTPAGDLSSEITYYRADPPTRTLKPIKDIAKGFGKLRYFYPDILGYDKTEFEEMRAALGELGVFGVSIGYPGFQQWLDMVQNGLESLTYAYHDRHNLIEEWRELEDKRCVRTTMLHSCGKERALVEMCARETDSDCVNPLEPPPMGYCDLEEVKRSFGHRLSLMGNLHTTGIMLSVTEGYPC